MPQLRRSKSSNRDNSVIPREVIEDRQVVRLNRLADNDQWITTAVVRINLTGLLHYGTSRFENFRNGFSFGFTVEMSLTWSESILKVGIIYGSGIEHRVF